MTSIIAMTFLVGFTAQQAFAVPTETIVNGDFETGTLASWTTVPDTFSADWHTNNGAVDPFGPSVPTAPISGSFDVFSQQNGPSETILLQQFNVPSNVVSANLSWNDRIFSHANLIDPNQEARVQIRDATGTIVLANVFSTNQGDPAIQAGPNARVFDITSDLQALEGQTVTLAFDNQVNNFFFNWFVDDVSLLIEERIDVDIDIKPGSEPNSINPKSMGVIPVAILGSDTFDVTTVDVTTLAFGPGSASPVHDGHLEDVNSDGFLDLVSHYKQKDAGMFCGSTSMDLNGATNDGTPLLGSDSVNPVPCNQ
jgi:hypothetical protein